MHNRRLLVAIALVVCVPLVFSLWGTSRNTGLIIGIVLVAIGIGSGLFGGSRRSEDDARR